MSTRFASAAATGAGRTRLILWMSLVVVAFPLTGLLSLAIAAYLSSLTSIGATARELVLAAQTALWAAAMVIAVLAAGRIAIGTPGATTRWMGIVVGVGSLLAIGLAYSVTSHARAGGILDADTLGPSILVPALVIFATDSYFAGSLSPPAHKGPWRLATFVVSVATAVLSVRGISIAEADPWLVIALCSALIFALILVARSYVDIRSQE